MRKRWKSGLSFILAAALAAGSIGAADFVSVQKTGMGTVKAAEGQKAAGTTYYIDAKKGDDGNNGTTQETAWQSFANLKDHKFTAGDQILLKAGCTWNGEKLEITGAEGSEEAPVVLGKYGEGANPVINGQGDPWLTDRSNLKKEDVAVVHVKNSQYVTIENLEVTNWESDSADLKGEVKDKVKYDQSKYMLTGILVENRDAGEIPGIVIRNNYVHDVNGYMSQNGTEGHKKGSGGIMVLVTGGTTESYYKDLEITGNKVEKVCHEAIYMESCWAARTLVGGEDSQQAGKQKWVGWPDVSVTHNYVNDVAGDGIVLINVDGGVAEYNLVTKSASEQWDYSRNKAHAAIWMWDCNNVTMQYNEAAYTTSTQDGMAFDCDYGNQNVMYQYNYSHENKGGFWMACPGPYYTVNSVVRYNVSVNDGLFDGSRIIRVGEQGSIGHQVYNNTIYWNTGLNVNAVEQGSWGAPPTGGTDIYNNIFWGNTEQYVNNEGIHYEHNCVWGGGENAYPLDEDVSAVVADPGFIDVTQCTDGSFDAVAGKVTLGSAAGFGLQQDSPCIDAGIDFKAVPTKENLPEAWKNASTSGTSNSEAVAELVETQITAPEKDYSGNTVPHAGTGKVDIGAFEYQGAGTTQPDSKKADKTYLQALYSQAESYQESAFLASGWTKLISAKESAKAVLDNPNAGQKSVDLTADKLEAAIQGLERKDLVQEGTPADSILLTYNVSDTKDNAGFEKDQSDWGQWSEDEEAVRSLTSEQKHSGTKSLKLTKGGKTAFSEIGGIPVNPNTDYILEAWFYCPEGSDVTKTGLEAKHHNSYTDDKQDHKLVNGTVPADAEKDETGWSKLTLRFTTENYNKISVALSSDTATAYMDDVVLYPERISVGKVDLDKKNLEQALALEPANSQSYYTPGSWANYQNARIAAKIKGSDIMADQGQLDKAAADLENAYRALAKKANKRVLDLTYNSCKNKTKGNTSDTAWNAFQSALQAAKAALDNENISQADVDAALLQLKTARDNLTDAPAAPPVVTKKEQEITCTSSISKVYGAKAFNLNAKVKTGDGKLSYQSSDPKVAVADNSGKVTIKGAGCCTITITAAATDNYNAKTASVTLTVKPKKAALKSAKPAKGKKLTVKWNKDAKADGYEIQCSLKKNFKKIAAKATVKKSKQTSVTLKKLAKGKKYYVRVRAYKKAKVNGKSTTLNGAWSKAKLSGKIK